MSRGFLVGALLAVACGGSDQGAVFSHDDLMPTAGAQATAGEAGNAGAAQVVGGSGSSVAGQPSAGAIAAAGASPGGSVGVAGGGPGGASAGGAAQAGSGGAVAGGSSAGSGASGAGAGGKEPTAGSKADGGAGGEPDPPIVCPKGGLNCDGISSNGCETSTFDHDHCGDCDTACDKTQKCVAGKATGAPVCLTL